MARPFDAALLSGMFPPPSITQHGSIYNRTVQGDFEEGFAEEKEKIML